MTDGVSRLVVRGLAVCTLATVVACGEAAPPRDAPPPVVLDSFAMAPAGRRVRVEVRNTTDTRGLARRGMQWARVLGYDVVGYGNASPLVERTLVMRHAGDTATARRLARAFGATPTDADTPSGHVDFVVLLGADWRPPAEPFRP